MSNDIDLWNDIKEAEERGDKEEANKLLGELKEKYIEPKEYYCNKCNRVFETLNEQEQKEFNENNGAFVCSECINREMNEDNKIKCSCGKTFKGWIDKEDTCPDCLKKIMNPQQLNTTANSIAVETPKIKTPFCLFCRAELLPNPHGRKRLYCNDKCSMKYWIQNNKEKWSKSVRIASREYQRRKQKAKNEARAKEELLLKEEMSKENSVTT